ncbi:hypothetical protein, partial [Treponema endosymbiont of Eucomonympha sp.]|uniref:hypothetical protein n=1 Tax=Treponema endosymbiont of Eucomonympha sp. TaxID=1580831 RepID=UPI000A878936
SLYYGARLLCVLPKGTAPGIKSGRVSALFFCLYAVRAPPICFTYLSSSLKELGRSLRGTRETIPLLAGHSAGHKKRAGGVPLFRVYAVHQPTLYAEFFQRTRTFPTGNACFLKKLGRCP